MKIIAESAFNHNGDFDYLKGLANASKEAGADYFTFQVLDPDSFCTADYSKYDIYKENAFTAQQWTALFEYCKELNINALPCVLDRKSFDLCYQYGYRLFKIHATDILNQKFLADVSEHDDAEVLLETQCATYQDISFALSIIGDQTICIIHGFSNYPTEFEDLNLDALDYIAHYFSYPVGFADHTLDTKTIPAMAMAKGAAFLEKHITLSRNDRHFDWQVSLNKEEFSEMVAAVQNYSKAFGSGVKHPVPHELDYRNIMYKKVLNGLESDQKRADEGDDYLTTAINNFDKSEIGIALIARLKSERFKRKALKPILGAPLVMQLYHSLQASVVQNNVWLATSDLREDDELATLFEDQNLQVFRGHPVSVLDRMLSLAIREQWGGIFRVTGDNPLTSVELIDRMVELFQNHELDYVRANNFPFGVSAELFSTQYLWKLYLHMDNPLQSEYLSWFVLNDEQARKGAITYADEMEEVRYLNYSVDYEEDYQRVTDLLEQSGVATLPDLSVDKLLTYADMDDLVPSDQSIKLPGVHEMTLKSYIEFINNIEYTVVENFDKIASKK